MATLTMTCPAEGCDFSTPRDAPDFASRMQCLALHAQFAHPQQHVSVVQEEARGRRRPEARENMEEYEWQTFVSEWKQYKRKKRLAGDGVLVTELCESMSKRLLMQISQSSEVFPKNETEMLDSMKNHAVPIHPRIKSFDLLTSSPPEQFLTTLQGRIPNTSFSLATTNEELLKEINFFFLLLHFKGQTRGDILKNLSPEELVAYFQAKEKEKSKRPRSQSRGRSRSCSILKSRSENTAEDADGEERGRKRRKGGDPGRMMTRSRSRAAAGAKSVRIRSPSSDGRSEPEPTRESSSGDDPSADIPQPESKAKMRWSWICDYCGK